MIKRLLLSAVLIIAFSVSTLAGRTVPSGYACMCNPDPSGETCVDESTGSVMPMCFAGRLVTKFAIASPVMTVNPFAAIAVIG